MNWAEGLQRALDYMEENMDGELDHSRAARLAGCGAYQLQRMFSFMTGMTMGEYIRARRLTLAAADVRRGMKVIDVAVKYGYDSPDSFARAFARFHGMPPSEARESGVRLNSCSPLRIKVILEGGSMMDYRIENRPATRLLGFHRHFTGAPYGMDRDVQEGELFMTTRASQWLLRGMNDRPLCDMVAITDVNDEGYTFWYAAEVDQWTLEHMRDQSVTGIDFMDKFALEILDVPAGAYAVFRTAACRYPTDLYRQLRDAPEMAIYHWLRGADRDKRYIEVYIPVER